MKLFTIVTTLLFALTVTAKPTCSLGDGMAASCYSARKSPVLNIALVHYGEYMELEDLKRVGSLLAKRFSLATQGNLVLDIKSYQIIPLKNKLPIDTDYEYNGITDINRLRRIWYYENVGAKVIKESFQMFKDRVTPADLKSLDALLVVTEAQFDALGFASGRVGITENPMEVAWAIPSQGRIDYPDDYKIVDELIHEIGHIMFLGHTSTQCFKPNMTVEQKRICCSKSPSKNDVLSYCRQRRNVSESFYHKFEACNLRMIKNKIIPALLRGKSSKIQGRERCI